MVLQLLQYHLKHFVWDSFWYLVLFISAQVLCVCLPQDEHVISSWVGLTILKHLVQRCFPAKSLWVIFGSWLNNALFFWVWLGLFPGVDFVASFGARFSWILDSDKYIVLSFISAYGSLFTLEMEDFSVIFVKWSVDLELWMSQFLFLWIFLHCSPNQHLPSKWYLQIVP